jgi:hypothetical protein
MAHMWHRVRKGLATAGKIAGVVGTAALAAHAIHKGLSLHGEVAAQRAGMQALHDYRAAQMARNPNWHNTP